MYRSVVYGFLARQYSMTRGHNNAELPLMVAEDLRKKGRCLSQGLPFKSAL